MLNGSSLMLTQQQIMLIRKINAAPQPFNAEWIEFNADSTTDNADTRN
ncbi:hypothetical protein ACFOZY_15815 [Chungangia koreensis]|uniref:Uncharacterized protein n=1 Tax=Chungangia koreensis TaxID=752657 RepID=A0ABV8X7I2_9LACT